MAGADGNHAKKVQRTRMLPFGLENGPAGALRSGQVTRLQCPAGALQ